MSAGSNDRVGHATQAGTGGRVGYAAKAGNRQNRYAINTRLKHRDHLAKSGCAVRTRRTVRQITAFLRKARFAAGNPGRQ